MHLTFKNSSNPFQIVNIGKISDSYSISFVTSTTLDNYIIPAQFLNEHLDQDYFGYSFLEGFIRGFTSSQIPPTVTTCRESSSDVGAVNSVGDTLSFTADELSILFILINTEIDLASTPESCFALESLLNIKNKLVALDNLGG